METPVTRRVPSSRAEVNGTHWRGVIVAVSLYLSGFPVEAAIRIPSASSEVVLSRIPDEQTQLSIRLQPKPLEIVSGKTGKNQQGLTTRLLGLSANALGGTTKSLVRLCFQDGVQDSLFASWPSRVSWGVEQQVWLLGVRSVSTRQAEDLAALISEWISPLHGGTTPRRLAGHPCVSFHLPERDLHLVRVAGTLLFSPSLSRLSESLGDAQNGSENEPDTEYQPGVSIRWHLPATGNPGDTPVGFLRRNRVAGIEAAFQETDYGLEVTLRALGGPLRRRLSIRPMAPTLLESVPANPDFVIAGGGVDLLMAESPVETVGDNPRRQPFAFGLSVGGTNDSAPAGWKAGGAVARPARASEVPLHEQSVRSRIAQATPEPVQIDPLGLGWETRNELDRHLFGNINTMETAGPALESLQRRFAERGKDSLLAGVISPRLLALPIEWGTRLWAEEESTPEPVRLEGLAPVEFSLVRASSGLELRLFSPTPASYLVMLADVLVLLDLDYRGEWECLFQVSGPVGQKHGDNPENPTSFSPVDGESTSP